MNHAPQPFARHRAAPDSIGTSSGKKGSTVNRATPPGEAMKKLPEGDAAKEVKLTLRQREVLDFIVERVRADGLPPTIREIGAWFDIAVNAVHGHLQALKKKQAIRQLKHGRRGYLPVVGRTCPCCGRNVGRQ